MLPNSRMSASGSTRARVLASVCAVGVILFSSSVVTAQTTGTTTRPVTSKPATTKAATTKAAQDSAKAKAATTKAATTKAPAKPTTTKAATTKPSTTAKPAPTTRAAAAPTTAGGSKRAAVESYNRVGLYAGGATAGLGFGAGPSGGLVWRLKSASLPLVFRADLSASRFTQQPLTNAGLVAGDASLLHVGGAVGFEWVPGAGRSVRPYLTVSGGVYRFQGSGPAGTNGDITNGVFASTNDVALLAGAGVRLGQRLFLEARMVTVGDFQTIPVVVGVHF